MKRLITILLILVTGCVTERWQPNKKVVATLLSAEYVGNNRYRLRLFSKALNDTITYYERSVPPNRKKYLVAGWYSVEWDSTMCKPCDSSKYVPARVRLLN